MPVVHLQLERSNMNSQKLKRKFLNEKFNIIAVLVIIVIMLFIIYYQHRKQREPVILTATMREISSFVISYKDENDSFLPSNEQFLDYIRNNNWMVSENSFLYSGHGKKFTSDAKIQILVLDPKGYKYFYIVMFNNSQTILKRK